MTKEKITLEFLKSMLKNKQKQIHNKPLWDNDCELWEDEEWQLKKVIELIEMEIIKEGEGKVWQNKQ